HTARSSNLMRRREVAPFARQIEPILRGVFTSASSKGDHSRTAQSPYLQALSTSSVHPTSNLNLVDFKTSLACFICFIGMFYSAWHVLFVLFLEFIAEGSQGEALAGEIGAAGAVDDVETAELNDEFEAVGASDGIPTDVVVAFLKAFGSAAPAEDGYQFGEAGIAVGAVNPLPENVSGRAACFEIMVLVEDAAEVVDLGFFNGRADDQGVSF
ncbi:MAG: hypothetical protein ACJAVK_002780, partial [Akkermansiaceae bacterium]